MTTQTSTGGYSYPFEDGRVKPFFVANSLLDDTQALRARLEEDGYLFFKSVIPADALREVHRDFRRVLEQLGVVHPGPDDEPMTATPPPDRHRQKNLKISVVQCKLTQTRPEIFRKAKTPNGKV